MTRNEFFKALRKVLIDHNMKYHGPSGPSYPTVEHLNDMKIYVDLADELGLKEPQTKIVYEWMYKSKSGGWHISSCLITEEQAAKNFINDSYKKTGRSWEMPDEP